MRNDSPRILQSGRNISHKIIDKHSTFAFRRRHKLGASNEKQFNLKIGRRLGYVYGFNRNQEMRSRVQNKSSPNCIIGRRSFCNY